MQAFHGGTTLLPLHFILHSDTGPCDNETPSMFHVNVILCPPCEGVGWKRPSGLAGGRGGDIDHRHESKGRHGKRRGILRGNVRAKEVVLSRHYNHVLGLDVLDCQIWVMEKRI